MFTSAASNKLMDAQNHAASGKRILRPSDDVPGTNRALTLRSGINTVNQFANNITVSKPLVDAAENAMSDMVKIIRKIRDLTVKAATPDYTGTATDTYIAELNGFMSQLADIANTSRIAAVIAAGHLYDRAALDAILERVAQAAPSR